MRRIDRLLVVAIVVVLLLPGAAVGALVEACCGVQPTNLVVTFAPDPPCTGGEVTISGTYTVVPIYTPWSAYDTGVVIRVWEPDDTKIVDESLTLASGQTEAPKDFSFNYALTLGWPWPCSTYRYEVLAWSVTEWGREETSIVGGTITTTFCEAQCPTIDPCLEAGIRIRWAFECVSCDAAKNHGEYVNCRANIVNEYVMTGQVDEEGSSCLVNPVARTDCGKKKGQP